MATKKQKRLAGEAKAKREAEERRQSGLAAQKMAQIARHNRRTSDDSEDVSTLLDVGDKHRGSAILQLVKSGKNPTTGEIFSDYDMAEMERKANTPERRHLFDQICAGRAGLLNEQPPLGGTDDYLDSMEDEPYGPMTPEDRAELEFSKRLPAMTVGEFRDKMDRAWTDWTEMLRETPFTKATEAANRLHDALTKDFAEGEQTHDLSDPDMFEGVEETSPIPSTRFF